MRDFYIVEGGADHPQGVNWRQVSSGRDVINYAIYHRTDLEPTAVLAGIVGALLERAAVSNRDMMDLCGLQQFRIEGY
jgi:hypothetical protein